MNKIALEQELCITTLKTLTALFSEKQWANAVALYFFYYKQCKLQDTDTTRTTNNFIKKWLWWGIDKVIETKKILQKYNLIETVRTREKSWHIWKSYIKLKYYHNTWQPTLVDNSPHSDFTTLGSQDTNAYITNKEMLNKIKELEKKNFELEEVAKVQREKKLDSAKKPKTEKEWIVREDKFEEIWKLFPHQRNTNKQKTKEHYKNQSLPNETIIEEIKLISREIETNTKDHSWLQAMERWIRDLVIPNEHTQKERIKDILFAIMENKTETRKGQAERFIQDFWKDVAEKHRKEWSKQKNWITLKLT